MARGLNQVQLIGHFGKDPQARAMPSGTQVVNWSLATSEKWKDKQTGEDREDTQWHNCVAFGKLAEIIDQYARKGTHAFCQGKIRTRKWQDREGKDRYTTEIVVDEFLMLGGRPAGGERGQERAGGVRESEPQPGETGGPDGVAENFDDDIPF